MTTKTEGRNEAIAQQCFDNLSGVEPYIDWNKMRKFKLLREEIVKALSEKDAQIEAANKRYEQMLKEQHDIQNGVVRDIQHYTHVAEDVERLEAEKKRLEWSISEWKKEENLWNEREKDYQSKLSALKLREKKMVEALEEYGQHDEDCVCFGDENADGEEVRHVSDCLDCDCGLQEIISQTPASLKSEWEAVEKVVEAAKYWEKAVPDGISVLSTALANLQKVRGI